MWYVGGTEGYPAGKPFTSCRTHCAAIRYLGWLDSVRHRHESYSWFNWGTEFDGFAFQECINLSFTGCL